jgi:hypothetical protein
MKTEFISDIGSIHPDILKEMRKLFYNCFDSELFLDANLWILQFTTKLVGFAALQKKDGYYIIWNVCTDIGHKLGNELMSEIVKWAYKKVDLKLMVEIKNPYFHNAFKVYLRNNFKVDKIANGLIYMSKLKNEPKKYKLDDYKYLLQLIELSKIDPKMVRLLHSFKANSRI